MRLFRRFFFVLVCAALATSNFAHPQQPWSNILSPSRAIDWGKAGLPATFPDGETTSNPWTPPTRPACSSSQAGVTVPVPAGITAAALGAALHACSVANPSGSYLQLASGTFNLSTGDGFFRFSDYGANNVTLRGNGAQNTTISGVTISWGSSGNGGGGTLTASPAKGATSVTIGTLMGTPSVGNLAWFTQCDTGYSGTPLHAGAYGPTLGCAGTYADNGGLFVCFHSIICDQSGGDEDTTSRQSQQQMVRITSVTNNGDGTYTVGFTPGLYMPNWSTSRTAALQWAGGAVSTGDGLEDATVGGIYPTLAYASWVRGVAMVQFSNPHSLVSLNFSKNFLIANNYFYDQATTENSGTTLAVQFDSDNLIINNIFHTGIQEINGGNSGDVYAYNYTRDFSTSYYEAQEFQHGSSGVPMLILDEGNVAGGLSYDDTWSTHLLNTTFRNWFSCGDAPYNIAGFSGMAIQVGSFARFTNHIGNALGGQPQCPSYKGSSNANKMQFSGSDTLAQTSAMLWGQYDAASGLQQFNSSEVPTSLAVNAALFVNSIPASHTLPASFFMNSMTAHPSGGTGLNWWKVCTNYPTCSTTQTPPMPPIHPENTGGAYLNGHVDAIPAMVAYNTLPIVASLQNHYTISGSSWSGGIETLTFTTASSGTLPNGQHFMGGFQLSGVAAACFSGATLPNGEILMTGSSVSPTYTVKYALASDPGNCTGQVLWPDVRAFDGRVYQVDPSSSSTGATPDPPLGLNGLVK